VVTHTTGHMQNYIFKDYQHVNYTYSLHSAKSVHSDVQESKCTTLTC